MKTKSIIYFGETKEKDLYIINLSTKASIDISINGESFDQMLIDEGYLDSTKNITYTEFITSRCVLIETKDKVNYKKPLSELTNHIGDTFSYKVVYTEDSDNNVDTSRYTINMKIYQSPSLLDSFLSNLIIRLIEQYNIIPIEPSSGHDYIELGIYKRDLIKFGLNPNKEFYYSCLLIEKEVLNIMKAKLR